METYKIIEYVSHSHFLRITLEVYKEKQRTNIQSAGFNLFYHDFNSINYEIFKNYVCNISNEKSKNSCKQSILYMGL